MKNLLTFYCLIISFCAFAQAPQGFTYQAVATDNNGLELVEQNVSVRVSILSESSTGVEQWIETHSTTTDGFGLFTITIGEGTSTGNGAQSSFSDIDWGASEHHLKIEMDVDGGSEYQLLGTSQLMSVPYALYAESSGTPGPEGPEGPQGEPAAPVDYDSLVTIISADSSFTANFSGGIGGGGCDWQFPDGLNGDPVIIDLGNGSYSWEVIPYEVPSGKHLYITSYLGTSLQLNGESVGTGVIAKGGDIITPGNSAYKLYGYLVDENYFANCGGGSSSSATTNNQINNYNNILNQSVTSGTFNYLYASFPTNSSFKKVLNTKAKKKNVGEMDIYNPYEDLHRRGFNTLAYRDNLNLFDMILISSPLLDKGNKDFSSYKMFQAKIFNKRFLSGKKGQYKGYPFRSFSNGSYTGGYSDHFPVYMYLIKEKSEK